MGVCFYLVCTVWWYHLPVPFRALRFGEPRANRNSWTNVCTTFVQPLYNLRFFICGHLVDMVAMVPMNPPVHRVLSHLTRNPRWGCSLRARSATLLTLILMSNLPTTQGRRSLQWPNAARSVGNGAIQQKVRRPDSSALICCLFK